VFVDGGGEEGGLLVDLLACLEEGGLDAFWLFVAWSVVEGVLAVEMGVCCMIPFLLAIVGILRFEGEGVDAVADFGREDSEEKA
jgi:hypothetical protein